MDASGKEGCGLEVLSSSRWLVLGVYNSGDEAVLKARQTPYSSSRTQRNKKIDSGLEEKLRQ